MYDEATTTVRSAAGLTEEFKVGVGFHQGSALSPFLFAIIMDKLTEDIRKDAPWDMLFADDIVLSRQNCRELEDDLEKCTGEKRPESESEQDRVFEGWGCG